MKLLAPTVEAAKTATRARKTIGSRLPQPVDSDGRAPALWADCVAYIVDDDPAATVDDQDLIVAIAAAPGKIRPADDTAAKMRARLGVELAKAKADREAGKPVGREKPADRTDRAGGSATRVGR